MWPFKKTHNVIVVGADSMLGHDLVQFLQDKTRIKDSQIGNVLPLTHKDYDITDLEPSSIAGFNDKLWMILRREGFYRDMIDYDIVVNCAAYTDTYQIETDYEARNKSYELNAIGPRNLAKMCKSCGKKLIYISTDYVFSDVELVKTSSIYSRTLERIKAGTCSSNHLFLHSFSTWTKDMFPVNVYGMHKLIGEYMVKDCLPDNSTIIRTSWLYGHHKQKSFVHKVANKINEAIAAGNYSAYWKANADFSIPTWTVDLCQMIYNAIRFNLKGICHGCGAFNNYDVLSSFEFANYVLNYMKLANKAKYDSFKLEPTKIEHGSMRYPNFSKLNQMPDKMYYGIKHNWNDSLRNFVLDTQFSSYVA